MKNQREKIKLTMNIIEMVTVMAEGNPGAMTALAELAKAKPLSILGLDDMNIRGSQIWVGYSDYCEKKIERFVQCIQNRDQGMIDTINNECYHPEIEDDAYQHKAVTHGASWDRDGVDPERQFTHQESLT